MSDEERAADDAPTASTGWQEPPADVHGETKAEHRQEVLETVGMADYLAPEVDLRTTEEEAAGAIVEWAEGDPDLLQEAEEEARRKHHEESAELLHHAAEVAEEETSNGS